MGRVFVVGERKRMGEGNDGVGMVQVFEKRYQKRFGIKVDMPVSCQHMLFERLKKISGFVGGSCIGHKIFRLSVGISLIQCEPKYNENGMKSIYSSQRPWFDGFQPSYGYIRFALQLGLLMQAIQIQNFSNEMPCLPLIFHRPYFDEENKTRQLLTHLKVPCLTKSGSRSTNRYQRFEVQYYSHFLKY